MTRRTGVGLWLAASGILAGAIAVPQAGSEWTLLAGGNMAGYLSPCGCVKPMLGGLRRKAAAYQSLGNPRARTVVEMGPLTGGLGRQQEMKGETAAETLGRAGASAISFSAQDARHGAAYASSLERLSGGRLLASANSPYARRFVQSGPLLIAAFDPDRRAIGAALESPADAEGEAIQALIDEAGLTGKAPVLMLESTRADAARIARQHQGLSLVLYRSASNPPLQIERVGRVALATPGEKGKFILRLTFLDGAFRKLAAVPLGPEISDDSEAERLYRGYQQRVAEKRLLEMLPRSPGKRFAGNKACMSCHGKAAEVWKESAHAKALRTLVQEHADRDPDCVSCHVVALGSEQGFRSASATPQLAHVGCESCHGPGRDHAARPAKVKMGRVGARSCASCHVPDHSPGFDFASYWSKIKH